MPDLRFVLSLTLALRRGVTLLSERCEASNILPSTPYMFWRQGKTFLRSFVHRIIQMLAGRKNLKSK